MERNFEFRANGNSVDFSVVANAKAFIIADVNTGETLCSFINFGGTEVLEVQNYPIHVETLADYEKQIVRVDATKNKANDNFFDCNYVAFECEDNNQMIDLCEEIFDVLTDVKISVLE